MAGSLSKYVLYWARVNRRADFNRGLAHAVELANERNLPVLFYEELRRLNDRLDTFVLEGVPDTAKRLQQLGIGYEFRTEGTSHRIISKAAAVVTDEHPFLPKLDIPHEAIDSSCIVPMNSFEKREYAAYTIRPKIRKLLPRFLEAPRPLRVKHKWTAPDASYPTPKPSSVEFRGGSVQARKHLDHFCKHNLHRYAKLKNQPSAHATSDLSPYLHFGHISALEVALAVRDYAAEHKLIADEFLEELIVRRELAFNFARYSSDPGSLENLPDWARQTLHEHSRDTRDPLYSRKEFIAAQTHDPLWNATQTEMLKRGKIHGYYRMYWGKKILEWSRTPQEAVDLMIHIHDVWALDGRDPNTYANVLWCLGLHDRPWPERPIFGKVRYMSYDGMRRKTDTDSYIREIELL